MAKKPQAPAFAGKNQARPPQNNAPHSASKPASNPNANPQGASAADAVPQLRSDVSSKQVENNRRVMGGAIIDPPKLKDNYASWPFWTGMALTISWFVAVFFATMTMGASGSIAGLPITTIALGISGVIAPVAFVWMIIAYLQRASDVKAITEPLRRQLQMVLGTGANAENRVRRFNEALERQLELLRQAGDGSYDVLQNAVQVLQEEERAINSLAERSGKEIQRVAGIVRDNSEVLEDLLHDNRERFNDLSGRIAGHIATLDERADLAAGRLGDMVDRLHSLIEQFKAAADQKLADVADVSEKIGRQEKDTEEASRRMNDMLQAARLSAQELNGVLSKNQDLLDGSGQRLMSRMQEMSAQIENVAKISDEKERRLALSGQNLSETMTREIAALEALTSRLESQISAANHGIGAQTDELEVRQAKLAEQAGSLMQNLQNTFGMLDTTAQQAFEKYTTVRDDVAGQSERVAQQFRVSGANYEAMAERLEAISKHVVERIANVGETLSAQVESITAGSERASAATQQASQSVGYSLHQLDVMIERIFDAEKRAKESMTGVVNSMEQKLTTIGGLTDQHVARLNTAHDSLEDVGQKLVERAHEAEGTWQSMVDAANKQQAALQLQLRQKVEDAIELLNENAHAIEAARDSMYAHVEAGLARSGELAETLSRVGEMTDAPFNEAVARVKASVSEGGIYIDQFTAALHKNAQDISELNQRMAHHGDAAGHKAAETLAGLDAVAARMEAIQHSNMQATQDVLLRLNHIAQQIQNRMGDISTTAEGEQKRLAECVRQLSLDINGLIHDSQTADQRIRIAASLLSEQAVDVRTKLEAQAKGIESSLTNLNGQFGVMADQMRETTDVAQQHIEEISKRYGEITAMSKAGLEEKIEGLSNVVRGAADRLSMLGDVIEGRTEQLSGVRGQIQDSTRVLDDATQQALDRLSVFTHAVVSAKTASSETAQEVYARLQDVHEQFNRQVGAVSQGGETIARTMRDAVANLVEQSVGLAAASQQAEQRIQGLASTTSALQFEAQQVRASIENEAKGMQNRLADILAQIESASVSMERNAVIAFDRTEGMTKRFDGVSQSAFSRLGEAATQIEQVADKSIAKVGEVNKALTDQLVNLTFAGEHLAEVDSEIRRSAQESTAYLNRLASEAGATASFAADQLRQQVVGLKTEADGLLRRFDTLGNGLANQSMGIFDVVDGLEAKIAQLRETTLAAYEDAFNAGQRVLGSAQEFRKDIGEAVQSIAIGGDVMQQRSEVAISLVHEMAGRFAEATQQLRAEFETEAARLQDVAGKAQGHLQGFTADLKLGNNQLEGLGAKLASSGSEVNETLEKTNFLMRNVTAQIDRMKASTQDISNGLLQRMAEMIATFESEIKGMTDNAAFSLEDLNQKARGLSIQMRDEAQLTAGNILDTLETMRGGVEETLTLAAQKSAEVMGNMKVESGEIAKAIRNEAEEATGALRHNVDALRGSVEQAMEDAVTKAGEALYVLQGQTAQLSENIRDGVQEALGSTQQSIAAMQLDFRAGIVGMVEVLVTHLRQIQENGNAVVENIRSGAVAGSDQAMEVLKDLRSRTEAEVRAITGTIEGTLHQIRQSSSRMAEEVKTGGSDAQLAALQSFTAMREQMENELRIVAGRAQSVVSQLQDNCDQLAQDIRKAVTEAEGTSQNFGTIAAQMRNETAKIASSVSEAGQNLSAANSLLQRSQSTLFDVAQKSSDALGLFSENITHQARNLSGLQQTFVAANDQLSAADERMTILKTGFQNVLSELMERLNGGLVNLGQQILLVKSEAQAAAQSVNESGDGIARQNNHILQTAQALAQALSQLEAVNRTLGSTMRDNVSETAQQAKQISALSQQVQQQVSTLENAAQAAAHQSVAVSQALDTPIAKFDNLNERMDKTLNLTVMVGDKITGQLGNITREMEQALHSLAEGTHQAGNLIHATTQELKIAKEETVNDMLGRLRDLAARVPQGTSIAAPMAQPQPQLQPQAQAYQPSQYQPQPQPRYVPQQTVRQTVIQPAAQQPAPQVPQYAPQPAARKQDSDLISSLTQIIQQLEETAGAAPGGVPGGYDTKQKKVI